MKLNAIFNYDYFCKALADTYGFEEFDDEYDIVLKNIENALFRPELYKEVNIYDIPVDHKRLYLHDGRNEEGLKDIAKRMTDFANSHNIKKILIAESISELSQI